MPAVPKPKRRTNPRRTGRALIGHKSEYLAGRRFDSNLERNVYAMLLGLEQAGEISNLSCQHKVYLTDANIGIIPDFSFVRDGKLEFVEAKGFETDIWLLKVKLWGRGNYGPGPMHVFYSEKVFGKSWALYKHSYVPSVSKPVRVPYWKNLGGMKYV